MKIFCIALLMCAFCRVSHAQIGINNDEPLSELDVNADVSLRGKLYVGGTEAMIGNQGLEGQVLVSSGEGQPPRWLTLNIPDGDDFKYYLIYNNTFDDETGISFTSSEVSGNSVYSRGTPLSTLSNWELIPGLSQSFEIYSNENKTYFTFETVAHLGTALSTDRLDATDYACGIFVDGKLEGVRVNSLEQMNEAVLPFRTMTMLLVSENLSKGQHTVDVGCTRRAKYSTNATLGIGKNVSLTNLNNFMAKSTMKIEVFEIPEQYVDIND